MRAVGAVFLVLCLPATAHAEMLFSVSAGVNRVAVDMPQLPPPPPLYESQTSTFGNELTETAPRVTLNLDVPLPFLRFEAGWADLGSHTGTVSATVAGGSAVHSHSLTFDADVRWIAIAPEFDLGPFAVSGKGGIAHLKIDGLVDMTEPLLGVSAGYFFDSGLGIRLDAERIGNDATQFGASISFRF